MIVIGYRDVFAPQGFQPPHENIFQVYLQTGGYAVCQVALLGFVLRLEDASEFALQPIQPLVRGFQAISETGLVGGCDVVALEFLGPTWGEPYSRATRERLSTTLGKYLVVPPVREGTEALVMFEMDDHLRYFSDWHTLSVTPRVPLPDVAFPEVSDYNAGDFDIAASVRLNGNLLRSLASLTELLPIDGPPLAFLAWENSD